MCLQELLWRLAALLDQVILFFAEFIVLLLDFLQLSEVSLFVCLYTVLDLLLDLFLCLTKHHILLKTSLLSRERVPDLVFFIARQYKRHFNEELLAVLPNLRLVPEYLAEKSETWAKNKVKLDFSLM